MRSFEMPAEQRAGAEIQTGQVFLRTLTPRPAVTFGSPSQRVSCWAAGPADAAATHGFYSAERLNERERRLILLLANVTP